MIQVSVRLDHYAGYRHPNCVWRSALHPDVQRSHDARSAEVCHRVKREIGSEVTPTPKPLAEDPALGPWRKAPILPDVAPAIAAWRGTYEAKK
jgi:hypothetical protein